MNVMKKDLLNSELHMMKKTFCMLFFAAAIPAAFAHRPTDVSLGGEWLFHRGEVAGGEAVSADTSGWERVKVPHDWAIGQAFDMNYDKQYVQVVQDGEKKARERTGRTGALPTVGVGWYRKTLELPESEAGKRVYVQFDGAMSRAKVWLNGEYVGEWPYGYASFELDLTKHFKFGQPNKLAVRLENPPSASRWYSGAGIFRDVRLVAKPQTHVENWGTYVTTPKISEKSATCRIETSVADFSDSGKKVSVRTSIISPSGKTVAQKTSGAEISGGRGKAVQEIEIKSPDLWAPESPALYTARTEVLSGGEPVDEYFTKFGVRSISYDRDGGFKLNGKRVQFKGVCMHHDLGPIGAAFNVSAARRQLEILKDMGVNAIRTSHNPPAPALLDLCDEMGILAQVEAFDEWKMVKCENGYNKLFDKWAKKDLEAMIRRDRNHPCVVMWSIGNEVPEQTVPEGRKTAKFLADIVRAEDSTRPVTAGCDRNKHAVEHGFVDELDLVGFNYKPFYYKECYDKKPRAIIYGSETASTVSSRGVYHFPTKESKNPWSHDYQVTSYDLSCAPWSQVPEDEWKGQDENPFVLGEFVWTGFDYLGEPFPYDGGDYIAKSSYFGAVDLCGFPKDRFYLYRARWRPEVETLHVLPHWTWPDRVGQKTPVYCYTNYPKAELFINGKSMGVREKGGSGKFGKSRLIWEDAVYEPGEIKVVAYSADGKKAAEKTVKTAGEPARLEIKADKKKFGGEELCFVEVSVVDKDGNLCPRADNIIYFSTGGNVKLRALCNGDPTDLTPFGSNYMRAFSGKLLAVLEADGDARGSVTAASGGKGDKAIKPATVKF